ncbi:MAG: hypothetical protein IPI73_22605 [Betaproteobacteria bacterium]|nr:hypothetical protein [Betaproteobacteria bacterium]
MMRAVHVLGQAENRRVPRTRNSQRDRFAREYLAKVAIEVCDGVLVHCCWAR